MERVHITKERKLITYTDLWRTSEVLLERAKAEPRGSYYLVLASLTFAAFALEAFLNHVGDHILPVWRELEVLSPKAKVTVLCERLGLKPDWGAQPWQIIPRIMAFRNKVAHGKSETLRFEAVVANDEKYEDIMREFLFADWQNDATVENAQRAREQLHLLFEMIHAKAGIEDDWLFHHGSQTGSGEFLRD